MSISFPGSLVTLGSPDTMPSADDPIAWLESCHQKIASRLDTLSRLADHHAAHGSDEALARAVERVLRYFDEAAPLHHADEDIDLFPRLRALAAKNDDRALTAALDEAAAAHGPLEARWTALRAHLVAVAAGTTPDAARLAAFVAHERDHLAIESARILPAARRLLDAASLRAIGEAMAARRGLDTRAGRTFQYPRA